MSLYCSKSHQSVTIFRMVTPIQNLPHHVTSLPQTETLFHPALVSTAIKEHQLDPLEKKHIQNNLNRIREHNLRDEMPLVLEQLARGQVYHLTLKNETIYLPINNKMVTYNIEEIPLGFGLNAFGLTAKNSHSILLFRGCSFYPAGRGALATLVADLDPMGVGHLTYKWSASKIKKWCDTQNQQVIITGHSLGAAFATYAAIDNATKVSYTETHAGVGVSTFYKKKWDQLKEKPKITYHPKDDISEMGHARIGKDLSVTPKPFDEIRLKNKTPFKRRSLNHRISLLDKEGEIKEKRIKIRMPAYLQRALSTIPFIAFSALLIVSRLLFANYTDPQYSQLGSIRVIWHRAVSYYCSRHQKEIPNLV